MATPAISSCGLSRVVMFQRSYIGRAKRKWIYNPVLPNVNAAASGAAVYDTQWLLLASINKFNESRGLQLEKASLHRDGRAQNLSNVLISLPFSLLATT